MSFTRKGMDEKKKKTGLVIVIPCSLLSAVRCFNLPSVSIYLRFNFLMDPLVLLFCLSQNLINNKMRARKMRKNNNLSTKYKTDRNTVVLRNLNYRSPFKFIQEIRQSILLSIYPSSGYLVFRIFPHFHICTQG